jgi:sulfur-oxidizing protein SoxY
MPNSRRTFIHSLLGLSVGWLAPLLGGSVRAQAGTARALRESSQKLNEAMAQETGGRKPVENRDITLETPNIAEDGAVVPISVESRLPQVEAILIFVEKNPNPLAARFQLDQSMESFVSLRIKMNETSDVIAVVKSGNEFFSVRKKVTVVVGGCG